MSIVKKYYPLLRYTIALSILLFSSILCGVCTGETKPQSSLTRNNEVLPIKHRFRNYWPTQKWRVQVAKKNSINIEKIEASVVPYAFGDPKTKHSKALLIIKNGEIAYEKYTGAYKESTRLALGGVGKCFVNALVGVATTQKMLTLDELVMHNLPEISAPEQRTLSIRHLLTMSSGITWKEGRGYPLLHSSTATLRWGEWRNDMLSIIAKKRNHALPGSFINASSANSQLLLALLRKKLRSNESEKGFQEALQSLLFDTLGISQFSWGQNTKGNLQVDALYMSSRDLAKLGFLYLNDGYWNKQRLLNADWMLFSRTLAVAYLRMHGKNAMQDEEDHLYPYSLGAHFYLNITAPVDNAGKIPWPSIPADSFACLGQSQNQRLFIIPSLDLLIVRMGHAQEEDWNDAHFLELVAATL